MSAPDGFAAGLAVAPLSLAPAPSPDKPRALRAHQLLEGLKISVATSKEQELRLGFGWAFSWMKGFSYVDTVSSLRACSDVYIHGAPTDSEQGSMLERRERKKLEAAKGTFVDACRKHVPALRQAPESVTRMHMGLINAAEAACDPLKPTRGGYLPQIAKAVTEVHKAWFEVDPNAPVSDWSEDDTKKLGWETPNPLADTSEEAILTAFHRHLWDTPQWRLSAEGTFDLAAFRWGFSPETVEDGVVVQKPLPRGELKASRVKAALYFRFKRAEALVGFGGGQMLDLEMKVRGFLQPSAQFGVVVASLDPRRPLIKDGRLNTTTAGEMPPRLVVGLEGALRPMLGARSDDVMSSVYPNAHIEDVHVGIFGDFRVQRNLSFRLGIPIEGRKVLQKKDEPNNIDKEVGMQWSIPVFLTSIVAM